MNMKRLIALGLVLAVVSALQLPGATIYVDYRNTSGTTNGQSWATAWTTIQQGADDLTNQVPTWGHTVLVATGTYAETVSLATNHTGIAGATNAFVAVGDVLVTGSGDHGFHLLGIDAANRVDYIRIDGFHFSVTTDNKYGIYQRYSRYCVFENCVSRGGYGAIGIGYYSSGESIIQNWTIYGNSRGLYWRGGSGNNVILNNCIIAGNGEYGIYNEYTGASLYASNNCIYANGINYCRNYQHPRTYYNTQADFDGLGGWVDTYVVNPGFTDAGDSWNFNSFYEGSVCLTGGLSGGVIGAYTTPATISTSDQTYYVAEGGDDGAAGTSEGTAWLTLTNAAAHAKAGDTVIVTAGTYGGPVFVTRGGAESLPLTFRASGSVLITNVFKLIGVADVVVDGFTFSQGLAVSYACSNTIMNVVATSDATDDVIAMTNAPCSLVKDSMATDAPSARCGLEMLYSGRSVVQRCHFEGNPASGSSLALAAEDCPSLTIERSTFSGAGGGGISFRYCEYGQVRSCRATGTGGYGFYTLYSYFPRLENCTFHGNDDYGVSHYGSSAGQQDMIVINSLLTENGTYGVWERAAADVLTTNCLFYNNGGGTDAFRDASDSVTYTPATMDANVEPAGACSGTLGSDPTYADTTVTNLQLKTGSPAIDYGIAVSDIGTYDLAGNVRLKGSTLDLGAYEWQPPAGTLFMIR